MIRRNQANATSSTLSYGSSSLFPTNSFNSTSYGVDVPFKAPVQRILKMHAEIYSDRVDEITVSCTIVRVDLVSLSPTERDANNNPKKVTECWWM
jgi:hypothetical protein